MDIQTVIEQVYYALENQEKNIGYILLPYFNVIDEDYVSASESPLDDIPEPIVFSPAQPSAPPSALPSAPPSAPPSALPSAPPSAPTYSPTPSPSPLDGFIPPIEYVLTPSKNPFLDSSMWDRHLS